MHAERGLIRAVMEAGASGYILKDDQSTARDLGNVVLSVAGGGIYFSQKAHQLYARSQSRDGDELLTLRQLEALSLCAAYPDEPTAKLARKMAVANSTFRNLLSGAYVRLEVHTRVAAIVKARQLGLITPEAVQ
jgi:DNA-binding NarL/FixJ family response regulator